MKTRRTLLSAATIASMAFGSVIPALAASEPVVGAVSPTSASINASTNISVSYNDPDGVASCHLFIDGVDKGAMNLSGGADSTSGTASLNNSFGVNGASNVQVRCMDSDGNYGMSAIAMLTTGPATPPAPSVGAVTWSGNAVMGTSSNFSATFSDTDAVSSCVLLVDGSSDGSMTVTSGMTGTATVSRSFDAVGAHQLQARCTDAEGNVGHGPIVWVNVMPTASASAPTVGAFPATVSGMVGQPVNFSVNYSDTNGVGACKLFIDDAETSAAVTLSGGANSNTGSASASHTFSTAGQHTGYFRCTDANGSAGLGNIATFNVFAAGSGSGSGSGTGDTTAPSVPLNLVIMPGGGNMPTFNWSASTDNSAVTGYETSIDGAPYVRGNTNLNFTAGTALSNGPHTFSVRAFDAAGNVSGVATTTFTVTGNMVTPPITPVTGGVITLEKMNGDALFTFGAASRADFESTNGKACEWAAANASTRVTAALGGVSTTDQKTAIENFVACGTGSTMSLGAGERLGIVNSFRSAYGRLPNSQEDWFDVIKIGNGRFPGRTNADAETRAKASFKKVYLRDADTSVTADNNAVTVMAYGLRPLPRSLSSEAAAIVTFRAVYGRTPTSAADWDIVRATAYSGATR